MDENPKAKPCVDDIITLMERLAPSALAESWDNCGLQVGSKYWGVKKIWVALDPLLPVITAASKQAVDLLITHHPLIFKPLSNINLDTALGKVIEKAISSRTAIFAAHTNLDSAADGINDILADLLGMKDCVPLVPSQNQRTVVNDSGDGPVLGLGRIGRLEPGMSVEQLVKKIKSKLNLSRVRVAGNQDVRLGKIAVCSGGGGGLLDTFLESDAQAYICGDLRYHDARAAEDAGKVLVDVGHFPSEHIVVDDLTQRLQSEMAQADWKVQVEACLLEKEPFDIV